MRPYLLPHYTTATLVTGGRPSSSRSKDWPESWLAQIVPSVRPAKHSEVSSCAMASPRGMPTHGEGRPFVETCHVRPPSSLRAMPESPPSGRCQPPGPTAVTPLSRKPGLSGCDASGVDV